MTILEAVPGPAACATCVHFAPGADPVGVCRRRAPSGTEAPHLLRGWPKVGSDEACGEHERALRPVEPASTAQP